MDNLATLNFLANDEYYLPIRLYENTGEFVEIAEKYKKKNWQAHKDRIFMYYQPGNLHLPEHGWKIHVSASIHNSKEILSIVSKYCFDSNIAFKFWLDQNIFETLNSKNGSRSSAGKFITIYPQNTMDFIKHIENINTKLKNYVGPYILTDRRYKDNKVLYYRYGQIFPKTSDTCIYGPEGQVFIDNRAPIYQQPEWVIDPFYINKGNINSEGGLLNNRYKVKKALRFTNAGGTYLAQDSFDDKEVIIKEGRPYTAEFGSSMNSITMKENEFNVLTYLKERFNNYEFPQPIEIFKEWEHIFVVESYIKGDTIEEFVLKNSYFSSSNQNYNLFKQYIFSIFKICKNITSLLDEVHSNGIYLNDINPGNIIIDDKLNPTIVDLDSAINIHTEGEKILVGTTGFYDSTDKVLSYKRDYKGIGYLAFYMLTPTRNLATLEEDFIERHLEFLERKYNLPNEFSEFVMQLIFDGSIPNISIKHIEKLIEEMEEPSDKLRLSNLNLNRKIKKVHNFLDESTIKDPEIMYPSNPFAKNYIGLESGTTGVLLALNKIKDLDIEILNSESKALEFLRKQYNLYDDINHLDFGLLNGKSGIIWVLLDINNSQYYTENIINSLLKDVRIRVSNKDDIDYSIEKGITGKALLILKMYLIYKKEDYLNLCKSVCNRIIDDLITNNLKLNDIGLNKGTTGISLLFYYMYKSTGDFKYFKYGYEILKKDLYEYKEISEGWLYPSKRREDSTIFYPYLSSGTAGIFAVFMRYYKEDSIKFDKSILYKLMKGMQAEFSIDLGLFSGLTGLIHVHYDAYLLLEDENMNERALSLLENLLSILPETKGNTLKTPGQIMYRYGCDYSNGGAGIVELMNRIEKKENDYYIFLDSYFKN
ncbi:protein kinase/lanthionine synthetase C family protein [Salinicoccus sp. ID82-1]|uniref:protein kinase/lanthionine synthetase C family protein n=1 Tax=Salinicoccus sp. ID82-1 TaxID=2820269 RepID=UPI001F2917F8|nr:protein kinase/lanthionine synthetase C family protein [Salinicoccus sp. ID82-1]MCG1010922.1 protein kinase/lanthionine synthetase C family protein [Salinicoccus sp. ID82-1]